MTATRFDTLGRRIPPPGWHKYHRPTGPLPALEGAACRGHNPDLWQADNSPGGHPRDQAITAAAIAICRTCPIQAECLQHALTHNEFGIWGGTTDHQRKQIKPPTGASPGGTQMTAQVGTHQTTPESPPERLPRPSSLPRDAITCPRCDNWWTGLIACHCGACHRSFTSVRCFDLHRKGGKCLNPADVRNRKGETALVPANRPWPGWSEPGTWEGPDELKWQVAK